MMMMLIMMMMMMIVICVICDLGPAQDLKTKFCFQDIFSF